MVPVVCTRTARVALYVQSSYVLFKAFFNWRGAAASKVGHFANSTELQAESGRGLVVWSVLSWARAMRRGDLMVSFIVILGRLSMLCN